MKTPGQCPACKLAETLVDDGEFWRCTDRECGQSFSKNAPRVDRVRATPSRPRRRTTKKGSG